VRLGEAGNVLEDGLQATGRLLELARLLQGQTQQEPREPLIGLQPHRVAQVLERPGVLELKQTAPEIEARIEEIWVALQHLQIRGHCPGRIAPGAVDGSRGVVEVRRRTQRQRLFHPSQRLVGASGRQGNDGRPMPRRRSIGVGLPRLLEIVRLQGVEPAHVARRQGGLEFPL